MAKRDKLYTVNKWNKPFFEEERRKRLYGYGSQIINGLGGLDINGYGKMPINTKPVVNKPGWIGDTELVSNPWRDMATVYAAPSEENSTPSGNSNQQDVASTNNNSKLRMIQDAAIAARDFAEGFKPITKLANLNESITKPTPVTSTSSTGLFSNTGFGPKTTVFTETPYTTNTSTVFSNVLNPRSLSQNVISPKTTSYVLNGADGFANANNDFQKVIGSYLQTNPQSDFAKYLTLDNMANSKIALPSLIEGYTPKIKGSGISDLGKAGIGIGASVLGEVGGNVISDGFSTTPGTLINQIGSTAGSVISMIPGVGWWVGPAITLGSKFLGGVYNRAFGSEYKDNGASAYTNRLNALNPNGSNEYLANLLANTGSGPRATSRNGWFNHSAERRANKTNTAQDLALDRFRRGIKNAFDNNNWKQLQYALNNNITAMGGKLNKCKCNKKSYGGYLDSATPTGFNFLSDMVNIQEQKNQIQQDGGTSLGNSFMGIDGNPFAAGGSIHINPAHKGQFTAKAKRHGMGVQQFANHVLAHKDKFPTSTIRQAVFAKNSRTWQKAFGGKLNYGKDQDIRNNSFFNGATLYELGGILQAGGSNWGRTTEINAGGTHEESPYDGVQVGLDPEGTPNLVEEGEVIFNDYVFSNRITVPKEVCKRLRIGQKKNGYTFADAAKKLLVESKERPNDPISKNGLEANMQLLEDAQEEVKRKMEAEQAVEQFNSLPPEQQVAIMNQEGQRAQDAVAQEQMAQEIQNMPPEQQQAIAQQMMPEQAAAQGLGMPQGQPSPEEQAMMQQQMAQQQGINPQEAIAQASAMQQQALAGMALGGKLCFGGKVFAEGGPKNKKYINGAKSHWETNEQGHRVLVPNTPFENTGFGGGRFGMAGGGGEWDEDPAPLAPKKRDWLAIDYKESFNDAYRKARNQKKKTFWFNGKEYSTDYNPNLTEEQVRQGMTRYQDKGLIIAPWEHSFGGRLFAEGGELNGEQPVEQPDNEMAKYSDEELQDMIDDYQEAESGEVKVTKGKLARLKKKAEKAEAELERRHADENEEQPQEARQEPSQEELQAAAQAQAMQTQQPIEGQLQEGMSLEGMSPEQAMMMQQQMGGQPLMSPEEMAAMELQQQGNGQYAYGGKLYLTGGDLMGMFGLNTDSEITKAGWTPEMFGISSWYDEIPQTVVDEWVSKGSFPWSSDGKQTEKWIPNQNIRRAIERGYNPFIPQRTQDQYEWHKPPKGALSPFFTSSNWTDYYGENPTENTVINSDKHKAFITAYPSALAGLDYKDGMTLGDIDKYMKKSANWKLRQDWLWKHADARLHRLDYMASIAANNENAIKNNNAKKFSALGIYDFKKTDNGYSVQRKKGVTDEKEKQWWDAVTSDYKYGDMYNTPDGPLSRDVYIDQDTGDVMYSKPGSDWTQVGNPYSSFINGTDDKDPGYNQNIYFYKRNGSATPDSSGSASDESNYLTVGWKPKTDWTGLALGVAPGLTGLAMQLGRGAPDMSELDKAVAAYERNTGTMVAPHLTHGLIRPAIIDPRVTENSLNARRLGTNRLLMNTGSTPSRGATILANDANTIGQLGQAMINNWRENRQQEQAAAAFNRETNTTNANILNQVDQFNAQTQSALARDAAQLRYNVAKDKIAARDAYYAGLMGNLGSVFKGGYEAWRENQRKNERDLLAASGVFGETNNLIDDWLGISKVDPKTHKVVRGYNTGMYYWINPNTGKAEYLKTPPLATNTINACGGKIKKNKKRKGYTF